ncbi:MAG: DoxX family membrane protein [Acidobacteria bacterium]|nr:DoxX family membrane protein [Acidobacteriota bacterium]
MVPLTVMVVAWIVFRILGVAGGMAVVDSWTEALRFALATMFVFTAASHFIPRTRNDLVRMVPPGLPVPGLLIAATGVLELAGAIGLLLSGVVRIAAYGLIALLVAMFPANVHAARMQLPIAGQPAMPLITRLPLQFFWIGALWWVAHDAL